MQINLKKCKLHNLHEFDSSNNYCCTVPLTRAFGLLGLTVQPCPNKPCSLISEDQPSWDEVSLSLTEDPTKGDLPSKLPSKFTKQIELNKSKV